MLNNRQILLVDILSKTPSPRSMDSLMKVTHKSKRTILRDLSTIKTVFEQEKIGAVMSHGDGLGYQIRIEDDKHYQEIINQGVNDEEIILYQLVTNEYVTVEELSEKLYVSKMTTFDKLNDVKENYQNIIKIEVGSKGHYLQESIVCQCILLSNIIQHNIKKYLALANMTNETYQQMLLLIESHKYLVEYFPNVTFEQMASLFIAALLFKKERKVLDNPELSCIYEECSIPYNKQVIALLSEVSDTIISIHLSLSEAQIKHVLEILGHENNVDIMDQQLINNLYQHLKRILCYPIYLKTIEVHNISDIKATHPFSFDLSIAFSETMKKVYGYTISNMDLIGLYFAVSLNKANKRPWKIFIYSKIDAVSLINKQLLEEAITHCQIEITEDLHKIIENEAILVINSVDHQEIENKYTIHTKNILSELDIKLAHERMTVSQLSQNVKKYFPMEASFTYNVALGQSYQDVLEEICKELEKQNYISNDEKHRILQRERQGNALRIGNYALPHCISTKENFCMSIYIHLDKEIVDEDCKIHHVLLTIMSPSLTNGTNVFKFLYRYLNDYQNELSQASNYQEFIKFM